MFLLLVNNKSLEMRLERSRETLRALEWLHSLIMNQSHPNKARQVAFINESFALIYGCGRPWIQKKKRQTETERKNHQKWLLCIQPVTTNTIKTWWSSSSLITVRFKFEPNSSGLNGVKWFNFIERVEWMINKQWRLWPVDETSSENETGCCLAATTWLAARRLLVDALRGGLAHGWRTCNNHHLSAEHNRIDRQ